MEQPPSAVELAPKPAASSRWAHLAEEEEEKKRKKREKKAIVNEQPKVEEGNLPPQPPLEIPQPV